MQRAVDLPPDRGFEDFVERTEIWIEANAASTTSTLLLLGFDFYKQHSPLENLTHEVNSLAERCKPGRRFAS
jgi:hypothetical protein